MLNSIIRNLVFFVDEDAKVTVNGQEKYLRRVYKNYKLSFAQVGDTYTLSTVKNANGVEVANTQNNGKNFFSSR